MKQYLTNVTKRKFFQLEVNEGLRFRLNELAILDGITASDIVRMLINREYARRFNGHSPSEPPNIFVQPETNTAEHPSCGDRKMKP